jgi:hypothetical protein
MDEFRCRLSSSGFKNVRFEPDDDFDFVIGQNHCKCSRFTAQFLSPKISQLQIVDPTITSYSMSSIEQIDEFEGFLGLCSGLEVRMNESTKTIFENISRELENLELFSVICDHFPNELTNVDNVVSRYVEKKKFGVDNSVEVDFIASHFHELEESKLCSLDFSDLDCILSRSCLCILNEDSLFDFIVARGFENHFELFGFVRFEYLSADRIKTFCSLSQDINISMNSMIWHQLCNRLILPVDNSGVSRDSSRYSVRSFKHVEFKSSSPLGGIISYLTEKHSGNVHDKGVVNVTASSTYSSSAAKYAVDLGSDNYWESDSQNNSWLCYDFKDCRVKPTHYTIQSPDRRLRSDHYLKNWIVEVSEDGSGWTTIDSRENNSDLNGPNLVHTYEISNCDYCRMIRIRHQGQSWYSRGNYFILIRSLEFFGDLKE